MTIQQNALLDQHLGCGPENVCMPWILNYDLSIDPTSYIIMIMTVKVQHYQEIQAWTNYRNIEFLYGAIGRGSLVWILADLISLHTCWESSTRFVDPREDEYWVGLINADEFPVQWNYVMKNVALPGHEPVMPALRAQCYDHLDRHAKQYVGPAFYRLVRYSFRVHVCPGSRKVLQGHLRETDLG